MKRNNRIRLFILYIMSFLVFLPMAAYANETDSSDSGGKAEGYFTYEVIKPENQKDTSISYYDLKMNPSQKQTLQIRLNNPSEIEVTVEVALSGATTNSSGVIEYGPNKIEDDGSLKFPFKDIVTGPEEVVLAPGEEKILELQVNMPESSFEGYISGGVRLMRKGQVEEADSMVVNQIAYMVGILLSEQENEEIETITEDLKFNRVYPDNFNYRSTFMINFSNIQPIYMDDVTVEAQISSEGSDQVLYDTKKSQMRMAPNTHIDFPVSLNGEEMIAGDYRAKIVVTSSKGGRWEWDEPFTITDEDADKFNAQDLTLVQDPGLNWQLIAMIAGGVLGVIFIIFLIVHFIKKKKNKTQAGKKNKVKSSKRSGTKKKKSK